MCVCVRACICMCLCVCVSVKFTTSHHKHIHMQKHLQPWGKMDRRDFLFMKTWTHSHKCTQTHTNTHTVIDRCHSTANPAHLTCMLSSLSSAWSSKPHPEGQQQSKFQLKWKMPLIETEWMLMPLRLTVQVSAAAWGKKHLGQLFHYLKSARSRLGSQPRLRLGGTTIIITIRKQTAAAEVFGPGKNWMSTYDCY